MGVDLGRSVDAFLKDLASRRPTPGGGSAAALAGSVAGALGSMVCRLTVGKKGYEAVEEAFRGYSRELREPRRRLRALVSEDADAFEAVMTAFRMDRSTTEEKERRTTAIQAALKKAAEVPLETARHCADILRLLRAMSGDANKNAVSDVGVAAHMSLAALRAAFLNVDINLASISDSSFVKRLQTEVEGLERRAVEDHEEAVAIVARRLR
ncbi:MAG: cyclodeaminase/cyclohydrolase family protein [Candidatus Thermoplasmatota archaeon]|nr:cyclodeaminase/cyclohydrolase family protein [Candidatus Thermoplasmatota archaeon]